MITTKTAYPLAQMVSSPDIDAEIFFDFNDDTSYPDHESFSFGAPQLLGEPGGVGAEYDYRTISFTLVVPGDEDNILREQSQLAKQLMRDSFYFRFQLSANAAPIWFECIRSSPGETSLGDYYLDRETNFWKVAVTLVAEPFALGEQINDSISIFNNPSISGVGISAELPEIRGDVPAPLVLNVGVDPATQTDYMQPWISVMPLEISRTWNAIPYWQAEATSTVIETNSGFREADAASSGGNRVKFTFGTGLVTDLKRRLTWSVTPPFAGRYRVFARMGWTVTTNTGTADITVQGSGQALSKRKKTVFTLTSYNVNAGAVLELGLYTFPKGNIPTSKDTTLGPSEVGLDFSGSSPNAGYTVWVDYIIAVPIDLPLDQRTPGTALNFRDPDRTRGQTILRIDGENGVVQEVTSLNAMESGNPEQPVGNVLMVVPGARNILTYFPRRHIKTTSTGSSVLYKDNRFRDYILPKDSVSEVSTIAFSYRPRWLYFSDV